ncbi:MAG: hypothetical protein COY69_01500 [Candidatus Magasanikbacteria bacterium CG_4_10_14_0_8_um_filter_32_14]|uniref:GH10 domain-containing protein n=1 Tax=Candidatus Magasanikbacteria bacterium CG_4_10_14_0_8_um_filter_32_14 TaxID=1974640 RepID=A0A2M7R9Z3_9BACT|nr:MAG: hypothetical protein COY69_01500 [Candidatus Magasanikbacteria bacterium CG_4_10_14_0_8_um_filter_32_14]
MKFLKFVLIFLLIIIFLIYIFLWVSSYKKYSVDFGVSFSKEHAIYLGLDWKKVYESVLMDLKPKYIRLSAPWNNIEKNKGSFDFRDMDYMINEAKKAGIKVTLVVGQKAPRWPECYVPNWAIKLSVKEYQDSLNNYLTQIVNRYKNNSALELWQVENEPFIDFKFGECVNFRPDLVDEEIKLVSFLDQPHWTIVTDSGELGWWKKASQLSDLFGTTLYRVVRSPNGMVWTYDWLPPTFYRYKAILNGIHLESMYVSELQAEPWFTDLGPNETPIPEQMKTMNIKRLNKNIDFVERIGIGRAYLWGVEWWYWLKEKNNDSSYWNFVKELMIK